MTHRILAIIVALFIGASLFGCGGGGGSSAGSEGIELEALAITGGTDPVPLGSGTDLVATGTYSDGSQEDLTSSVEWTSSDPNVASVDENGAITPIAPGETEITAQIDGISVKITIIVEGTVPEEPELVSITISSASDAIDLGESQQFTATGTYTDGSTPDITSLVAWTSSDTGVATISPSGLASSVGEGETTITASLDGITSNSATLRVIAPAPVLISIAISPSSASIPLGNTQQFTATGTYSDSTTGDITKSVTWTSSDTGVATIDTSGLASPVAQGTTTITASLDSISDEADLTVTGPALTSITVSPSSASVEIGKTRQFTSIAHYSDGSNVNVTAEAAWTSADEDIATIDGSGLAAGIAEGETSITASFGGKSGSATLTVTQIKDYEEIFICDAFVAAPPIMSRCIDVFEDLGAVKENGVWVYINPVSGKKHMIYEVTTPLGMEQALKTEGAHVIVTGHSNYGLGATFTWTDYARAQVRYIDDDRIVNVSTDMVTVNLENLIFEQSYPNLKPVFKDGTDAIMPYDFDDPRGNPPFNYLLTYKIPGDNTLYFIERADGSLIDRFENSGRIAWDWRRGEGIPPDPGDPDERLYYITNPAPDYNHFSFEGPWGYARDVEGYSSFNFQRLENGGTESDWATWTVVISTPGYYDVQASWFYDTPNATDALYTIEHAEGIGYTDLMVDQRTPPVGIEPRTFTRNSLGVFYFETGAYDITVYGGADGHIIADYVYLTYVPDPLDPDPPYVRRIRVDNTDLYKTHFVGGRYGNNTVLNTEGKTIPDEELRYQRMFYSSCYSGRYFLGKLHRGQMFFTLAHTDGYDNPIPEYLRRYLTGQSDQEILAWLKKSIPIYEYYDFDQVPPSLR